MSSLFPHLFSPVSLGPLRLRNRIVSSGHDTMLAEDGLIGPDLVAYHERRAAGGAGLLVLQVSGVHETARYTSHVLMATEPESADGYRAVADAVHAHGAGILAQLFHPGREVMDGEQGMAPQAVAPSDEPQERFHVIPEPLEIGTIREIIRGYGRAAARICGAGIDGVEVVASHGYLPVQFINPRVNTRTDEYGGSPQGRMRFLLEAIESTRAAVGPGKVVGLRISGDDLTSNGMASGEFLEVVRAVEDQGLLDYISVTAGDSSTLQGAQHIVPPMQYEPVYAGRLSAEVKKATELPVMVAGRINQPHEAEQAIREGLTDLCIMTRAMICDPEIAVKAERDAVDEIRACIGCNQACIGHFQQGVGISCIQHPESGRELTFLPRPAVRRRARLLVVGGGPAGLKAAAVAAEAGAEVLLVERERRVGGQVLLAERLPHRAEFGGAVTNLEAEARRAGASILTGAPLCEEMLDSFAPDQVLLATGSTDREPAVELIDEPEILTARQFLAETHELARGGVLIADWKGDWAGLGIAVALARRRPVTLATAASSPGAAVQQYTRTALMAELVRSGVTFVNDVRLAGLDASTAYLQSTLCDEVLEVDDVTTTIVNHPPRAQTPDVDFGAIPTVRIGDCRAPRTVEEAVYEGLVAANEFILQPDTARVRP
ncbi:MULTISPECIES: FAD-dependent oxidoreductase [Brevibacterium]|uniref:FAD-dependent oxidoreductase n=1 Tax=Brevibacterium salitolerans TaxID=1403566 RepID=A0ABN2WIW6_9MICO|nr:FAD-dependent oxidoreductase [Brevibacterium sp.]